MRADMVEAQIAPLARPVEVARSDGRAKLARLAAAGDSARVIDPFDPSVKFLAP